MRKDMAKIIVERPRYGGGGNKGGREANTPLHDLPSRQGMRKKHKDRKSLNENLKPLQRYFRSQVGRTWNRVFSEVCKNISTNSTVQQHVRQHIPQMVHLNVVKGTKGQILDKRYAWGGQFHEIWHGDLYVDPNTGILRRYQSKNRRRRWSNPSPAEQLAAALKDLDLLLDGARLYKLERSRARSPKYDSPKVHRVLANGTHAMHDVPRIESALRTFMHRRLTRALYHDHEYFRVASELLRDLDAKRDQEKAALARKKAALA